MIMIEIMIRMVDHHVIDDEVLMMIVVRIDVSTFSKHRLTWSSIAIASDRRSSKPSSKELASIGKKAAEKSGGLFSPEDWMCKR